MSGYKGDLLTTISVGGVTTQTIDYTGDGNMANLSPGIQAPGGAMITSLGWNQNQRLSAVKSGSTVLASYGNDGFGQRAFKTIPNTSATLYQYGQDGMLLEEAAYKGTPLADYIYLDGRPVATLTPAGALYFLQDDMLGTPQLATDSSQNTAWQATYTPFGQASVSGTLTQNLRLPGQYYDFEGGWNHNGFRNYLPDMGRYMEQDPLAMLGTARFYDSQSGRLSLIGEDLTSNSVRSITPYAYVDNAPIDMLDVLGLSACKNPCKPVQDDIAKMRSIMHRSIDEMNRMGRLNTPSCLPGWLDHAFGWINDADQVGRMSVGKTGWGCINQANYVYTALTNSKFQAAWTFSKKSRAVTPHSWVTAQTQTSDKCPATVTLDPWADDFEVH